ncbi:MAG: histidine--tRNA ligase, partial [Synergistaceae bacterium]|nr:histidine--tRNA ligase [Synergistaceae bacterium]
MEIIKAPRGTRDVLGDESWKWARVMDVCRNVAGDFGYSEVMLPVFEHTELFSRGIGDATDVVEKEMYTFIDRGGRSITLRPELTASMTRSYLEHEMRRQPQPVKLWGMGPMFRYERPQKGRYRQFWQIDFEILGSPSPMADIETIDTSMEIYRRLGLSNLRALINSVGCPKCRPAYREALKKFIEGSADGLDGLCETCRGRFDSNP